MNIFIKHTNNIFRMHNKKINEEKKSIIDEIKKISLLIKNITLLKKLNNKTKLIKAKLNIELNELRIYKKYLINEKKILNSLKFKYLKKDKKNVKIQKEEENINNECAICLENIENEYKLDCNHKFCYECINKLIEDNKIKCPLCRNYTIIKYFEYDMEFFNYIHITDKRFSIYYDDKQIDSFNFIFDYCCISEINNFNNYKLLFLEDLKKYIYEEILNNNI